MIRQALADYNYVWASCTALFLFLSVFAGTLLWVFRKKSNEVYRRISDLPLED